MSQIKELTIQQFRGLRNLKLEAMGQINLLVGGNNSGKTSVLEALSLFCRPFDLREWNNVAKQREGLSSFGSLEALKWLFPQTQQAPDDLFQGDISIVGDLIESNPGQLLFEEHLKLKLKANFSEIVADFSPAKSGKYLSEDSRRGAELTITGEGIVSYSQTFQLWEDQPFIRRSASDFSRSSRPPFSPNKHVTTIMPHAHRIERIQIQRYSEATLQELDAFVTPLLQMFDADVEKLSLLQPTERVRPTLYIKHKRLGFAPLSSFGDGMRRILLFATSISLCRNGILLIDELETAIHTQALDKTFAWLIQVCIQNNVQLFATTHSLEAIDSILEVTSEDFDLVAYRLQQKPAATTAIRFDKDLLRRLRENLGQEVRW